MAALDRTQTVDTDTSAKKPRRLITRIVPAIPLSLERRANLQPLATQIKGLGSHAPPESVVNDAQDVICAALKQTVTQNEPQGIGLNGNSATSSERSDADNAGGESIRSSSNPQALNSLW